ncbi:hypothetical protein BsWGS_03180 [Bradybaena similaris]
MTEILCKWLNEELNISERITPATFAKEFSSGYLLGEVLHRYQLQDDFDQFSPSKTTNAKLNNFTRLEPMFHLLGIPFDTTIARNIMMEKHGTVTHLLYQMYIALNNKKNANLTPVAMKTLQPSAHAKLAVIETDIFKERLKQATSRQVDLDLQTVVKRFHKHQMHREQMSFKEKFAEAEFLQQQRQKDRQYLLERSRNLRQKQAELIAKINATTVHIPKLPHHHETLKAIQAQQLLRRKREADETIGAIHQFEKKLKAILPPSEDSDSEDKSTFIKTVDEVEPVSLLQVSPNDEYIGKIRRHLQENAKAREEREKRRRKVLNDQLNAHQAQEEARWEEMLVNRLLRQSQQERRIVVQLLQTRREKEVMSQNRILREKQYQKQREQDFQEALTREAEVAAQRRLEYAEQIKADQELHDQLVAQRAQMRYGRHYDICAGIVAHILDFASKVTEYRELTNKLVPAKLMRDWKLLFVKGQPLFEHEEPEVNELSAQIVLEEERQNLLDDADFMEYRSLTGEWVPPEICEVKEPPRDNPVVGHVLQRLFHIAHPPTPPPAVPEFPPFAIRACVLGKAFSGKSTCLKRLATEHNLCILDPEVLVREAIQAFKDGELEVTDQEVQVSEHTEDGMSAGQAASLPDMDNYSDMEKVTESEMAVSVITGVSAGPQDVPSSTQTESSPVSKLAKTSTTGKINTCVVPQLTARAQLGSKAMACLKKGLPVDDKLVVDILAESIRQIPEGTGWILEGYPQNYSQAKMLEKTLTGCDLSAGEQKQKEFNKAHKNSLLPYPQAAGGVARSGIDVVILFDIRDELCLKRAAGRYEQVQAEKTFHEEFEPPPDGSATGVGHVEKVQPVSYPHYEKEHLQTRITGFSNQWPKLQKWFVKYGTLKTVDASLEKEAVFQETENILEAARDKIYEQEQQQLMSVEDKQKEKEAPGGPPQAAASGIAAAETPAPGGPDTRTPRPSSTSKEGSARASSSPKDKKSRSPKGKKSDSGSPKRKASRGQGSAASDKKKNVVKVQEVESQPEPEPSAGPPPPKPGDDEWIFVDSDIDVELASVLMSYWEAVEAVYVSNLKSVFRNIRVERENIYRYYYQIRKDFIEYLRKQDCKQEYIAQWQKAYNEVTDDLRGDEEVKGELHQQLDDLVDQLWSICDERKQAAENERLSIMSDGWLYDHLGTLTNHYLTVIQAEVDRFQDTVRLLKDYYQGMEKVIPDATNTDYERVPLVELLFEKPQTGPSDVSLAREDKSADRATVQDQHAPQGHTSKSPRESFVERKSVTIKKRLSEPESEKVEGQFPDGVTHRITIPLVPRYGSNDKISMRESKDKLNVKKARDDQDSIVQSLDSDNRQIFDGYMFAVGSINDIVLAEMAIKEAEEEAERQRYADKEKERAAKKNIKGAKKTGSPTNKRSSKTREQDEATANIADVGENIEEELRKRQVKAKQREELYSGIEEEGQAAKARLEVVRHLASAILQDLKNKGDEAFKALFDWLGSKFIKEMDSIAQMSVSLHNAIEQGQKIMNDVKLEIDDFILDEDLKVLQSPSPEPPPSPVEQPMANHFTVNQLELLYNELRDAAPNGTISKKAFTDMFASLMSASHGTEQLPTLWMQLTHSQIEELSNLLSPELDSIEWRRLLVAFCYPVPPPTQEDLLHYLQQFRKLDQRHTGSVTREQWQWAPLWFNREPREEGLYDHTANLKKLLFEVFADHSGPISLLDYVDFLMYFSMAANYHEGFLRALSVATGKHMPRLDQPVLPATVPLRRSLNPNLEGVSIRDDGKTTCEPLMSCEVIPPEAVDVEVPLEALYKVLHHSDVRGEDGSRLSATPDCRDNTSIERLAAVYHELNDDDSTAPIMYRVLIEHPVINDLVVACKHFKSMDLISFISQLPFLANGSEVAAPSTLD